MADKEIIIDGIKYFKQCDINKGLDEEHYVTEFHLLATHYNLLLEDYARKYNSLKEQLKHKEKEYEELRLYHNKCCKENAEKLEQWLEKYNQVSRDFYNGKYCNKENCSLLKAKEQECEHWKNQCLCLDNEYVTVQITQEQFEEYHQYKQALDEIEQTISNFPSKGIQDIPQTQIECTLHFLSVSETKLQKILDIINKAYEVVGNIYENPELLEKRT